MSEIPFVPGLENVVAVQTAISHIDGQAGKLIYRGYDIRDLVYHQTFETVWHLLLYGELPNPAELRQFQEAIYKHAAMPETADTVIRSLPADVPFPAVVRSALSATYAAWGMRPGIDLSPDELTADCIKAAAAAPAVIAASYRIRQGLDPITPDTDLSYPARFVQMVTGKRPTDDQVKAVTRYMILTADHGMNASTFTARVTASTGADVGSAVVAAAGALSGPLHGGAPGLVLNTLDEIGGVENARAWAEDKITHGGKIMGFGHRVYKTDDPRNVALKATAAEIHAPRLDHADQVERIITDAFERLKPGRGIYANVEYYSAVALDGAGLHRDLFTPTFVVARTVGWTAHIREQVSNNRIMRPKSQYIGPALRTAEPV